MTLPSLDLPTLFMVSATAIAFSGLVLLLARGRDGNGGALGFWGAAMLLGAAGVVMLPLGDVLGPGIPLVGNVAILLGTGLAWTGARVFAGRPPAPLAVLAGPAAWLAVRSFVPGTGGIISEGTILSVGALYTFASATELWRGRREPLPSRRAAIVLLLLHGAVYGGRAVGLLAMPGAASAHVTAFLMFEAMLHTIGMAFLLLALMKERAELQATVQLREMALHDGLTGLGNRRQFDSALEDEFRRAARDASPLALLMIDVDHFKLFNDTYGHQAGDDCLRAVAAAIDGAAKRPADLAVRYGGEEFAVLLPGTDESGGLAVAEAVHRNVARLGIPHAGSPQGAVTASVGVAAALVADGSSRPDKLVRAADRALYEAKASGRNATRLASQLRDVTTKRAAEGG